MGSVKRLLTVGVLSVATLVGSVAPASAQNYAYGYPQQPYGYGTYNNDHPVLRNLLIGGALIGVGFAAGRLTAPRPYQYNYGYQGAPGYYGPQWHHGRHF
jgi:hypothetical protein